MAVTISGIKLNSISLTKDKETGQFKTTGQYQLESNTGMVLAKQSINGYQEIEIKNSRETEGHLQAYLASFQKDISNTLGLGE
jgi:hypothetical protein